MPVYRREVGTNLPIIKLLNCINMYVVTVNGIVHPEVFTSLSEACMRCGMSISSASHGKRVRVDGDNVYRITEVEVSRIKGRGSF